MRGKGYYAILPGDNLTFEGEEGAGMTMPFVNLSSNVFPRSTDRNRGHCLFFINPFNRHFFRKNRSPRNPVIRNIHPIDFFSYLRMIYYTLKVRKDRL